MVPYCRKKTKQINKRNPQWVTHSLRESTTNHMKHRQNTQNPLNKLNKLNKFHWKRSKTEKAIQTTILMIHSERNGRTSARDLQLKNAHRNICLVGTLSDAHSAKFSHKLNQIACLRITFEPFRGKSTAVCFALFFAFYSLCIRSFHSLTHTHTCTPKTLLNHSIHMIPSRLMSPVLFATPCRIYFANQSVVCVYVACSYEQALLHCAGQRRDAKNTLAAYEIVCFVPYSILA